MPANAAERSSSTRTDGTARPHPTPASGRTAPTPPSLDDPQGATFASRWAADVVDAALTTTCISCGGILQVGQPQLLLAGRAAHAICAVFAAHSGSRDRDAKDTVPVSVNTGTRGPDDPSIGSVSLIGAPCPACSLKAYPHHLALPDEASGSTDSHCRFEGRFPGWTFDLTAADLEAAAWEAQDVARDHAPSETLQLRCVHRRGCNHPEEWTLITDWM